MKHYFLFLTTWALALSCGNDNKSEKPNEISAEQGTKTVKIEGSEENNTTSSETNINDLDSVVFWESYDKEINEGSGEGTDETIKQEVKLPSATLNLVTSSVQSNSITLKWSKDSDATKYTVLWSSTLANANPKNLSKEVNASATGDEEYVISGIDTTGDNYVSIYACNSKGCNTNGLILSPVQK